MLEESRSAGPSRDSLARDAAAPRLMQRVHHLAEHVELQLAVGGIADAHRRGAFVARQPRHLPLGQPPLAGDAVHDLHLVRAARRPRAAATRATPAPRRSSRRSSARAASASRRAASRSDSPSCARRRSAPAARWSAPRRCRRSARRCSALSVISERRTASEQCPAGRQFVGPVRPELFGRLERRSRRRPAPAAADATARRSARTAPSRRPRPSNSPTVFMFSPLSSTGVRSTTMSGPATARSVPSSSRVTQGTIAP